MDYEQFEKEPGKSVSLLNNDPEWNRFVRYESEGAEVLIGYLKRKEFESYIVKKVYEKNLIDCDSIDESDNYNITLYSSKVITIFGDWALRSEPIYKIQAKIEKINTHQIVYEEYYLVRAPLSGGLTGNFGFFVDDLNAELFRLYSPSKIRKMKPLLIDFKIQGFIIVRFNPYYYADNFFDGIPYYDYEAKGKAPCLRYEWKVANCSNVVKGQHVCSVIKNPYTNSREEYKIYSPESGLIAFSINGIKTEYRFQEEMSIYDLFSIYRNEDCMISRHYDSSPKIEEDNFEGKISLSWEHVAERKLPPSEANLYWEAYYPGFEMIADSGKYIIVSLQVKNNIPFIVFSVDSNKIPLTKGDVIELLFVDTFGEKTVLSFPVTKNYVEEKLEDIYDISYYCKMSERDIDCMTEVNCVSWRIRFAKQPLKSISGLNESRWCPKEYAGKVFKAYAIEYKDTIDLHFIEYALKNIGEPSIVVEETCYVYLMYDTSTGYYKIGISNNPEYRERTLQSEKPTIEKICAKEYPNRTIAGAIESALHKAYDSKRLRGEWFALDANDVIAITATLS